MPQIQPVVVAKPTTKQKADPVAELMAYIPTAQTFAQWLWVKEELVKVKFGLPHKAVYEVLRQMPTSFEDSERNLRDEIYVAFAGHLLDHLTTENIGNYERRFMSLVQAASFMGGAELLQAKSIVLLAYKKAERPVSPDVMDRIRNCEAFKKTRGGGFTLADYESAGYESTIRTPKQITLVHPETRDSVNFHEHQVSSEEDRIREKARREAERAGRRAERLAAQPSKGSSGGGKNNQGQGKKKDKKGKK